MKNFYILITLLVSAGNASAQIIEIDSKDQSRKDLSSYEYGCTSESSVDGKKLIVRISKSEKNKLFLTTENASSKPEDSDTMDSPTYTRGSVAITENSDLVTFWIVKFGIVTGEKLVVEKAKNPRKAYLQSGVYTRHGNPITMECLNLKGVIPQPAGTIRN